LTALDRYRDGAKLEVPIAQLPEVVLSPAVGFAIGCHATHVTAEPVDIDGLKSEIARDELWGQAAGGGPITELTTVVATPAAHAGVAAERAREIPPGIYSGHEWIVGVEKIVPAARDSETSDQR
jgi:hypothetical protein